MANRTFTIGADYQSSQNNFDALTVHDLRDNERSQIIIAVVGGDDIVTLSKLQFETLAIQMGYVKK